MGLIIILLVIFNFNLNAQVQWVKIGNGLNYGVTNYQSGNDIAIVFGGWKSKQQWVNNWCEELFKNKLKDLGILHLLSVKGPDEVCYKSKEIDLNSLAGFVKNIIQATYFVDKVIIVAHSSGSFVANELLNILFGINGIAKDSLYINKVHYFNLDGGIGSKDCGITIDTSAIKHIKKVYAVAAFDSTTNLYSANYETMKTLAELFGEKSEFVLLDASNSGCQDKWCLHDVLIISNPHNPNKYDLEKDYQLFDEKRKVQTDYLRIIE